MKLLTIVIYTDGACSGNPGPGGWSALLLIKSKELNIKKKVTIKGGERNTTNNRMELTAVIEALKFIAKNLKEYKFQIKVISDSSYVVDSIVENRIYKWEDNGWKTVQDKDIKNRDLWEQIIKLDRKLSPSYQWTKGHATNKFNNYVDKIAVEERDKYKKVLEGL